MTKRNEHQKLVQEAINLCGGTQSSLAAAMGGKTGQGHVRNWISGDRLVSPASALLIQAATKQKIKVSDFYPEFFKSTAA